jgi:hypothetical protein
VEFGTLCQTDTKSVADWPKVALLPRTASFCISNRLLDANEWDNCDSVPFYDYHIDTPGAPAAACQRGWLALADAPSACKGVYTLKEGVIARVEELK